MFFSTHVSKKKGKNGALFLLRGRRRPPREAQGEAAGPPPPPCIRVWLGHLRGPPSIYEDPDQAREHVPLWTVLKLPLGTLLQIQDPVRYITAGQLLAALAAPVMLDDGQHRWRWEGAVLNSLIRLKPQKYRTDQKGPNQGAGQLIIISSQTPLRLCTIFSAIGRQSPIRDITTHRYVLWPFWCFGLVNSYGQSL